jgi:hypothetical protein
LLRRSLLLAGLIAVVLMPESALGAESDQALVEQRCVAAAMTVPGFFHTVAHNRHPQSKTESLTHVDVVGNVRTLPRFCTERYRRYGYYKAEIKSTTSQGKWIAVEDEWKSLDLHFGDESVNRPYFRVSGFSQKAGTRRHHNMGCVTQVRTRLNLHLQDQRTFAVIAARSVELPGEIDSWRTARCRGQLSIRDGARGCPQSVYGATTTSVRSWRVRALGANCRTAARVGQQALIGYSSDGDLDPRRVSGWTCYYSQNAAASCRRGRARIHMATNRGRQHIGRQCSGQGVQQLIVLGASCGTAQRLSIRFAAATPPTRVTIGGQRWQCRAFSVAPLIRYQCFAPRAAVSFLRADPAATGPYPTEIPAGTVYPGGGAAAVGRVPEFRIEDTDQVNGEIEIELLTEEGLIGRPVQVKVSLWKWKRFSPTDIRRQRRIGEPRIRAVILEAAEQRIAIGAAPRRGNWSYEIRIMSPAFASGSARYAAAKTSLTYLIFNA